MLTSDLLADAGGGWWVVYGGERLVRSRPLWKPTLIYTQRRWLGRVHAGPGEVATAWVATAPQRIMQAQRRGPAPATQSCRVEARPRGQATYITCFVKQHRYCTALFGIFATQAAVEAYGDAYGDAALVFYALPIPNGV